MAAGLAMMLTAAAQPSGNGMPPEGQEQKAPRMKRPTVEEEARTRTDQMVAELSLTEKQEKKVYKFFVNDIEYRRENFEPVRHRPSGNFPAPPEGGFPGGGPGGPGGMGGPMGGGFGPGMGPGGPGMGPGGPGMGPGGSGMRPKFEIDYEALDAYNAKQDKKLRKIIGDENFAKWRANHPQEIPKMPEPELRKEQ